MAFVYKAEREASNDRIKTSNFFIRVFLPHDYTKVFLIHYKEYVKITCSFLPDRLYLPAHILFYIAGRSVHREDTG